MTPMPPLASPQGSSPTAPQQGGMFPQQNQPQEQSAGRQLLAEVAPIATSLTDLASAHPELSSTIDQMLQLLKQGMVQAISQMSQGNEGGTPLVG